MTRAQDAFRFPRPNRCAALQAYVREIAVIRRELCHERKLITTTEMLRCFASQMRQTAGIFAVTFFGGAIAFLLFVVQDSYEKNILFLATCAVVSSVVYYVGDVLGQILDSFAESVERK